MTLTRNLVAVFLFLTSGVFSQVIPVTDVIRTSHYNLMLGSGSNTIPIMGPELAGLVVNGYVSQSPTPPDALTQIQIATSAPGTLNFSLMPFDFTMTTVLDAAGLGSLDITYLLGGGNDGTTILPFYITLTATLPGANFILVDTHQIFVSGVNPATTSGMGGGMCIFGCGGGGSYTGPGDIVPPNFGDGTPWMPGLNGCDNADTMLACPLDPTNDPLGCTPDTCVVNVPMFQYVEVGFDCLPGDAGDAGEVPYALVRSLVDTSTATYIDFVFRPADPNRRYEIAIQRPALALQLYCIEWLWMRDPGCSAVQIENRLEGCPVANFNPMFNVIDGFHFPASDPIPWNRAKGSGTACVKDLNCSDNTELNVLRVRYRKDCIKKILDVIEAGNPNFFPSTFPLFVFGGIYCPQ